MGHFIVVGLLAWYGAASLRAQVGSGLIRGVVENLLERPIASAEIQAQPSSHRAPTQIARTESDGQYQLQNLPPDTYDLKVFAQGFHSTTIRDVQLGIAEVKILPAVLLDLGMIADCTVDRPDYYHVAGGDIGMGAVGGIVSGEGKGAVGSALVTLYIKGKGRVSSTVTDEKGSFAFLGLQVRPEEYWITIAGTGYFTEEQRHLRIQPGFESVYLIALESCSPGRCQPYLKTVRVLPQCE